ncbi:MAG: DMT family transporter [Rhizobiaceae bacterium]|nr:DMT family transporter [Rhizobiaceae bacterium]
MNEKPNPGLVDYTLLVVLGAMFGIAFMWTKVAVDEVPPVTIAFSRIAIAAVLIHAVMVVTGQNLKSIAVHWKLILLVGLFGNVLPFSLVAWGQGRVDAGLTAILMAVMPLITLVLAHFFTQDEKLNAYRVVGFVLGLFGVAVLIGFDKLATLGEETIRQYAIMGAACCYGIHAILSKSLTGLPRRAVSSGVLIASSIALLPFSLFIDQPWTLSISGTSWLMLVLLGIFPTGIGTLMLFAIIQRQGAGFLSQINFLVPVFGVFWAILLLGETLPPNAILALVIILAGVAIARIKPKQKLNTGVAQ